MEQVQSPPVSKQVQITLRFPEEWLSRVDAIKKAGSRPGNEWTRVDALRYIVAKGLEPAEAELGIKPPTKKGAK